MVDENDVFTFMRQGEHVQYKVHGNIARLEPTSPDIPPLYLQFIKEEYTELMDAIDEGKDEAHIFKEALDLVWVTLGFCIAKRYDVHYGWQTLTRENLSKLQIDPDTGKLLRRPDGKILKPAGWKPADYSPFVQLSLEEGKVTDER
jgi:NTP pyrophosphatase (non-canonical NTP hydrolase)